jgi:hypothetical protein
MMHEGYDKFGTQDFLQKSFHVDKVIRHSAKLTDTFTLAAPLKERFKILWRIDHDDGPDPKGGYGELSVEMPDTVRDDGRTPD